MLDLPDLTGVGGSHLQPLVQLTALNSSRSSCIGRRPIQFLLRQLLQQRLRLPQVERINDMGGRNAPWVLKAAFLASSTFLSPRHASAEPASSSLPTDKERRRYVRWPLSLHGRYMLEDGGEFRCQTEDVSPAGMAFRGRPTGNVGERVVAYIDQLGRIEGTIVRRSVVWFALEIAATSGKLERLAFTINSLVRGEGDGFLDRPPTIGTGSSSLSDLTPGLRLR